MIDITDKAVEYIKSKSENGFRLEVKSSGCNGYKYNWTLANNPEEDDVVVVLKGVRLLIDKMSYVFVQDVTIDVEESVFSKTLVVSNPMAKNTCGCGESFNV